MSCCAQTAQLRLRWSSECSEISINIDNIGTKKKRPSFDERLFLVTLRGPSAKHFWDGIERFGEHLEELGVGDEEAENV
jgi:hypothetical protein